MAEISHIHSPLFHTKETPIQHAATVRRRVIIPIRQGVGTFISFRDLADSGEHIAIACGNWESQPSPLVRLHSECLTGDVFGSAKCDCGDQLQEALTKIQSEGGILLYLRQEGRGIGLYNKLDAYEFQNLGMDTYEANRILGFRDDERSYVVSGQMLTALGIRKIRLLSNNPEKKRQIEQCGIQVTETVRTGVFLKTENRNYLEAKVNITGHSIALAESIVSCLG